MRFYFTFNGPELKDTSCSIEDLIQSHNKFLVGVLGNFINRNLSFVSKKFDNLITEGNINKDIIELTKNTYKVVGEAIEKGEFRNALNTVIEYVGAGNKYYDDETPWVKVKEDINAFTDVTYTCIYMIANIANLIHPFMPNSSNKIREMLNLDKFKWEERSIKGNIKINNTDLLFTRIDTK